jgi:hypothetical protein
MFKFAVPLTTITQNMRNYMENYRRNMKQNGVHFTLRGGIKKSPKTGQEVTNSDN